MLLDATGAGAKVFAFCEEHNWWAIVRGGCGGGMIKACEWDRCRCGRLSRWLRVAARRGANRRRGGRRSPHSPNPPAAAAASAAAGATPLSPLPLLPHHDTVRLVTLKGAELVEGPLSSLRHSHVQLQRVLVAPEVGEVGAGVVGVVLAHRLRERRVPDIANEV